MAETEFSCVKQVVKTVQIPLPATFISNEIAGIAKIFESWKRQYVKQLQGVVLNYKHYSLSSPTGFIAPNKPFVYYNVKATFDLFCPKIGDIVKGKINRISNEHIGCLIEDTINVTIHLSKDSPKELSSYIYLNREILFEISYFNYDRKMIRVTGKITPQCIHLMKEFFPPPTYNNSMDIPELSNNTDEGIGTSSESADDGLLNHDLKINDNANFKKPFATNKKSKKNKKDSESSTVDTSDASTSGDKTKKKKKKRDKANRTSSKSSDTVSCETLIQNFSSFNHETLEALKEEVSPFEDSIPVKKKLKRDMSPSLIAESSIQNVNENKSVLDVGTLALNKTAKSSKKRKRESESSFMDTSEQSSDEMPPKKKKHKDKSQSLLGKEIKKELLDIHAVQLTPQKTPKKKKKHKDKTALLEREFKNDVLDDVTAGLLSPKKEIASPVETVDTTVPENKKKNKDKKNKLKKKKGKVLASGAVLKKDKKSHKKGSKRNKLDGKQSKKPKKSKSHKKDKSEKQKKNSKSKKNSDVIKNEID